jgi:hypothetical protein
MRAISKNQIMFLWVVTIGSTIAVFSKNSIVRKAGMASLLTVLIYSYYQENK